MRGTQQAQEGKAEATTRDTCIPDTLDELSPLACVNALERAAAADDVARIEKLYAALSKLTEDKHPFIYEGWALVLALRYGQLAAARSLLDHQVDLLGSPRHPRWAGVWFGSDEALTRFALTSRSVTFLYNPMDPTVATEVFRPSHNNEQLMGAAFNQRFDIEKCCRTVYAIAAEQRFSATVFCDLFRAALVRAWHALRHDEQDKKTARICLQLCHDLLALRRADPHNPHFGDERIPQLMQKMFVPRGSLEVMEFITREEPLVLFTALDELSWLRQDRTLVQHLSRLIEHTSEVHVSSKHISQLLEVLAAAGDMEQTTRWAKLVKDDSTALRTALDAASAAGHTELVAWIMHTLAQQQTLQAETDTFADLLL